MGKTNEKKKKKKRNKNGNKENEKNEKKEKKNKDEDDGDEGGDVEARQTDRQGCNINEETRCQDGYVIVQHSSRSHKTALDHSLGMPNAPYKAGHATHASPSLPPPAP